MTTYSVIPVTFQHLMGDYRIWNFLFLFPCSATFECTALCILGKSSTNELCTQLSGIASASEKAMVNMEVDSIVTKGHYKLMIC